jgi:predicted permease
LLEIAAYFEQLRSKVAEVPGVSIAAISSNATPPRNGSYARFEILGRSAAEQQKASINYVSPEYFAALKIPLLEGRLWTETENHAGAHVAVVNQTLGRRYFPNGDTLAHSLKVPDFEARPPAILTPPKIAESWLPIVGVVGDARNDGLTNPITPAVYLPYTQNMRMGTQILVKSQAPPLGLLHAVRAQLTTIDPEQQSFSRTEDLDTWITDQQDWQQERLAAWIFGVFGGLALALAAVGLYSVVSYTVAQRTNEFGVRMALGAPRGHVLRIVFTSTVGSLAAGIGVGLALSVGLNTVLAQWAKANSNDPAILLAGALVLSAVSALASAIPAWYATRVDPMTALRSE